MDIVVGGHKTFCYTGGKALDPAKPTSIFVHGALNDHSVWILQTRYLANHGWNVLAPDLPGHGKSAGDAPRTVEAAAEFVLALMDAAGLAHVALVGHSFGSLIALEVAARSGERVSHPLKKTGVRHFSRLRSGLPAADTEKDRFCLRALLSRVLNHNSSTIPHPESAESMPLLEFTVAVLFHHTEP